MATRSSGGKSTAAAAASSPDATAAPAATAARSTPADSTPADSAPARSAPARPAARTAGRSALSNGTARHGSPGGTGGAANGGAVDGGAVDGGAAASRWSPLTAGEELTGAADPRLRTRPFGLADQVHKSRFALVGRLLWLLAVVLAGGVGMLVSTRWTGLTADDVSDFVTMIFGAVVALAGCAVGACFGGDRRPD